MVRHGWQGPAGRRSDQSKIIGKYQGIRESFEWENDLEMVVPGAVVHLLADRSTF